MEKGSLSPKIVEIAPQIYWVGERDQQDNLSCNPYLIMDKDEAILLDPGSSLDFEQVFSNVLSLTSLDKIIAIVLHHQDPDLCASVPLFEKHGVSCPIVLHWRTATIVKYYGIKNPFYIINEKKWAFRFSSGRTLKFIPAPYCHFPGSIMTLDEKSGTLFSGDLFGAFSHSPGLYAKRDYIEPMKAFHEHYIPSREILRPVITRIQSLPIKTIAPQHGKIIKDKLFPFLSALKDLHCGTYLSSLSLGVEERGSKANIPNILNEILYKLSSLYSEKTIRQVFMDTPIVLNESTVIIEDYTVEPLVLWNGFFNQIFLRKGIRWLTIIEPFVVSLVLSNELPLPDVYRTELETLLHYDVLSHEATASSDGNSEKLLQIKMTQEGILNDDLTGLFNQRFLWTYLNGLVIEEDRPPFCLVYIALDNLQDLNRIHGWQAGDEALRSAAYLLKNYSDGYVGHMVSKLNTPAFAYLMENCDRVKGLEFAEKLKGYIRDSDAFLEKTTASMGIFYSDEIEKDGKGEKDLVNAIFKNTLARLRLAQEQSNGSICDSSIFEDPDAVLHKRVLFVEPDSSYIDFITPRLEKKGFHIMAAADGQIALDLLKKWKPDVIVAEAMTPKINGFELRERSMTQSGLYRVPFLLISYRKDEDYIRRAARLGITIYLKKPFSYYELEGLVLNLTH